MKFTLTISAQGDTPELAMKYAKVTLDGSIHEGKPRGFVFGRVDGSAVSKWLVIKDCDEGDDETSVTEV